MSQLVQEVIELLAKQARSSLRGQELVDWATRALAEGHDTPAITALAGLDLDASPRVTEAFPLFQEAIEQLQVEAPVGEEAILRAHLRELARQMCAGTLSLDEGVARVEQEVVAPLGHPSDLMPWCYVGSDLHPDTLDDLKGTEWNDYVRRLASDTQGERGRPTTRCS